MVKKRKQYKTEEPSIKYTPSQVKLKVRWLLSSREFQCYQGYFYKSEWKWCRVCCVWLGTKQTIPAPEQENLIHFTIELISNKGKGILPAHAYKWEMEAKGSDCYTKNIIGYSPHLEILHLKQYNMICANFGI